MSLKPKYIRLTAIIVVLVLLSLVFNQGATKMVLPVRGTLIVTVLTKEGLVICGDKRSYDELRGDIDNIDKITSLAPNIVATSTGTVRFYEIHTDYVKNTKTLKLVYDADDIVKEYFLKNKFENKRAFWDGLEDKLGEGFQKFLSQTSPAFWPKSAEPPNYTLYQLIFFYLEDKGEIKSFCVQFMYKKEKPSLLQVKDKEIDQEAIQKLSPTAFGNTAIYDELYIGKDQRFNDVRADKIIKHFIKDKPSADKIEVKEAVDFSGRLITISSERTHLIENTTYHIGPTYDCALLSYKEGFKWLEKNIKYSGNFPHYKNK